MKCKWRKAVLISISVFCVLIAVYVFVLPPFVQKQLNDLGNIEIEYNGSVQSITNADEISDVLDHMKMSEWERTFNNNSNTVPEVYIAANNRYLLSFILYSNQDFVDISICFLRSRLVIGNYKMETQDYNELVNFLGTLSTLSQKYN